MRPALLALLLLTTPIHAQWQLQDAHTTADLRGIHSLGNGVAWASGTNGTVLRTEDAGFVWQLCTTPPNAEHLDFRGIQAFSNNNAIVMSSGKGDLSRLYKTTDGCQTWTLLATNPDPDGFFDAFTATSGGPTSGDKNVLGDVLGDPVNGKFAFWNFGTGPLFDSSATAASRHHTPLKSRHKRLSARPGEAAFAASNSALFRSTCSLWIATGGSGGARVARDSIRVGPFEYKAEHLDATDVPLGNKSPASGAFSLSFKATGDRSSPDCDTVGVVVGGDYTAPDAIANTAAATLDGGKRWVAATTPPHGYRSAVAYDPTHQTWITVGPNGTDFSTDDGRNWHPLKPSPQDPPDADQHWNALSLPFVVGPHGRIATLRPDALPTRTNGAPVPK